MWPSPTCGGTVGYARALATMETWRDVPNFAMAATGSPVAARVARLLGVSQQQNGARTAGVVTASLVLATALIAGAVSFGVANPALAQSAGGSFQQLVTQADQATCGYPVCARGRSRRARRRGRERRGCSSEAERVRRSRSGLRNRLAHPWRRKQPAPAAPRGAGETCEARFARIAAESARSAERTFVHRRNEFGRARESRRR